MFSRTLWISPYRKLWSVSIPTSLLQRSATGVVIGLLKVIRLDLISIITFWFPPMRSFISRSDTPKCMESNIVWPDTSSNCSCLKLNVCGCRCALSLYDIEPYMDRLTEVCMTCRSNGTHMKKQQLYVGMVIDTDDYILDWLIGTTIDAWVVACDP